MEMNFADELVNGLGEMCMFGFNLLIVIIVTLIAAINNVPPKPKMPGNPG